MLRSKVAGKEKAEEEEGQAGSSNEETFTKIVLPVTRAIAHLCGRGLHSSPF
jgi:hypothetical protein